MNKVMMPLKGGKYIRGKDGSLERVGGTDNDPKPAPAKPTETTDVAETPVALGDDTSTSTKKGK